VVPLLTFQYQKAKKNPTPTDITKTTVATMNNTMISRLQQTIGNKAFGNLIQAKFSVTRTPQQVIQRDAGYIPAQESPYENLIPVGNAGPGENFDANQRQQVLQGNEGANVDVIELEGDFSTYTDDSNGRDIYNPVAFKPEIAEVDHILPAAAGGMNTVYNAQVLSGKLNNEKGDTYPWGDYSGARIYDPVIGDTYDTWDDADQDGADLTTLQNYPQLVPDN
jgi:hypothetical protein